MAAILSVLAVSCNGDKKNEANGLPANFSTMSDQERMDYMMRKADPDSVAHFLCYAFLGRVPGAKIDTLALAYIYAYESYRGDDADRFGAAFELVLKELSLADKMKTQFELGLADTLSVGYDLGLGYVGQIRRRNMSIKEIDADIAKFRESCGRDTATYNRFVKGFRTVLELDRGKDLSNDIYNRYIGLKEERMASDTIQ